MKEKYLPVGTVVRLNNGKKYVVIIGYKTSSKDKKVLVGEKEMETASTFDYAAVTYPEGLIDSSAFLLFNHNNIAQIIHMGYESKESKFISDFIKSEFDNKKEG